MKKVILNEMMEEIRRRGYEVDLKNTMKNGLEMEGIVFKSEKLVTPILYVDSFVKEVEKGKTIVEVVENIIEIYKENDGKEIGDIKRLMDRDFLIPRLRLGVQRKSNEYILKKETEFENIDCFVYVNEEEKGFSFKLKEEHLQVLDMQKEEVFEVAKKQTFEECTIRTMSEVIGEMVGIQMEEDNGMFVVTTKSGFRGASAILNKKMIKEKMEEVFGDEIKEVIILPSSIHECILLPRKFGMDDLSVFDAMVKEVNANEVEVHEILGGKSYLMKL